MNPSNDKTEAIVRIFGNLAHRAQPQISIAGETRYPSASKSPNITWVEVLKGQVLWSIVSPTRESRVVLSERKTGAFARLPLACQTYMDTSLTCVAMYQVFPNTSFTAPLRSP